MKLYRSTCFIQLCLLATLLTVNIGQSVAGFAEDALARHNELRAKHGASPMKINETLNKLAQDWANKLVQMYPKLDHRPNNTYGENLYSNEGLALNGATAVDAWYSEICMYDFNNPGYIKGTGHFTQVIWKGSTQLGIAKTTTADGKNFVVANYSPAGNNIGTGKFASNIQAENSQIDVQKRIQLCGQSTTSPPGAVMTLGRSLSSDDEKKLQDCVSILGTVKTESSGTIINLKTMPTPEENQKIQSCLSNLSVNTKEIIKKDIDRALSSNDSTKIKDCLKKLNIWYTYSSRVSSSSSGMKTTLTITVYSSDVQKVQQVCLFNL